MLLTRFAVAACLALGVLRPAFGQATVTLLDTAGDVGTSPSLAVGSDGLGLIAYHDATNADLKVARCSNTACTAATITTIDSAGDVGRYPVAAIGADGRGIVSYLDASQQVLKVAHCNDAACTSALITVVEPATISNTTDLAIGSDGLPLLVYRASNGVHVAHCAVPSCASSTITDLGGFGQNPKVVIGANGLGLITWHGFMSTTPATYRCLNVACSAALPVPPLEPGRLPIQTLLATPTAMALPVDGRVLIGYTYYQSPPFPLTDGGPERGASGASTSNLGNGPTYELRMSRCADQACSSQAIVTGIDGTIPPDVAIQTSGLGWFAHVDNLARIRLRTCTDASCTVQTETCAAVSADAISLARAGDGHSLIAFHRTGGGLGIAHDVSEACAIPQLDLADAVVAEGPGAQARFTATLSTATTSAVTVSYQTANGTAVAGQDYEATNGSLTFAPGVTSAEIRVPVLEDFVLEPNESFFLNLSTLVGATLGDGQGVGTIVDGTPVPEIVAGNCERVEGDAGTQGCVVPVSLDVAFPEAVTVDYATSDGTASTGLDYIGTSGTLTFTPGSLTQTVSVAVIGDISVELDETFFLNLSNPVNATILDGIAEGTIVDDDAASLSSLELTHGSAVRADLAALPGPLADQDLYRLAQGPYSSWEVVADEVSGDVAPGLLLERLAEDNSSVLQAGTSVGTGSARAMRWQRREATPEERHHIRVRSTSCGTDCGSDDRYRLRAYETTGVIPRFNNAGSQVTVLILQNATGQPVEANADFWDASGALRATLAVTLGPNGVHVVNTSSVPALVGVGGSVTVTSDGPYGGVIGKTVALEPATGFSFDSPMVPKPR